MRLDFRFLRELRWSELRQVARGLGRARMFAATAILTLAFGVAANVTVFGVLDALVLQPMPGVPHAEQLSFVQHGSNDNNSLSFPQYRDFAERNRTFSGLGAYALAPVALRTGAGTEQRWATVATGSYFDLLSVKPYLGRFFSAADDVHGPNGSPYAVLTYATWKDEFSGRRDIAGRNVEISKHPFTVLGVAPPGFVGTERFLAPALWVDMWNIAQLSRFNPLPERGAGDMWVLGRRKPGVSVAAAQADMNRVAAPLRKQYPTTDGTLSIHLTQPGFIGNYLGGPIHAFLAGLMLLAALVLLASCANLGGLYAARAADRARELSLRMALGSSRARVVGRLMLESLLLAGCGGLLGCVLGREALLGLTGYRPPFDFPVAIAVDPGPAVYGFAVLLSLGAGLVCGLIPAREAMRAAPWQMMKAGGATAETGRRLTLRDMLLLLEVTLCCVMVTAAIVSLRGLERSLHLRLGFDPAAVTLVEYDLNTAGYHDADALVFNRAVAAAAARVPGVAGVAYTSGTPLDVTHHDGFDIFPTGTTDFRPQNIVFDASLFNVSQDYFSVAGTRLVAGRAFTDADSDGAPAVAIVNEQFARKLFGTAAKAVGGRFFDGERHNLEIVGVTEDGKYQSLDEAPDQAMFRPAAQQPPARVELLVRVRPEAMGDESRIAAAVTAIVKKQDPSVPISGVVTWQQALAPVLFPARAASVALGVLGALALLLAVTGIFGLASYAVSRRMREFGIRVALGAARGDVLGAALGRVAKILLAGSVAGIGLGLLSSRVLAAVVYGATASDPVVLAVTALTMAAVGCAAAALPARRALGVDPAMLLREE